MNVPANQGGANLGTPQGAREGAERPESVSRRGSGKRRDAMVPPVEARSYYDRPVIKPPAWTWEVPWYFFFGGLAGASASLAAGARVAGRAALARAARRAALGGTVVSPPLLIADLGRPDRFHHMLRVFKPTSPLSVGSWILAVFGPAATGSAVLAEIGRYQRLQRTAETMAGVLGPAMTTYTAALFANSAVPVWHEARHELPFVFTGSAAASAGAATVLLGDNDPAARRLAVAGAALELGASEVMERRLGELAEPYHDGDAGRWSRAAKLLTGLGAALMALAGKRRGGARTAAALLLGGSLAQRWAVYRAGFQSAADPKYTLGPQRRRLESRK